MQYQLRHPPGPGSITLGPLTGAAQFAVTQLGAADAIGLIDRGLVAQDGAPIQPGEAARLSVSDRDWLMAQMYRDIYGDKISGSSQCSACEDRFDFEFSLSDLIGSVEVDDAQPEEDGWYHDGETRFRLPTGADELAVRALPPREAASVIALRCAPDVAQDQRSVIEGRLARIAPLIDLSLQAACPECGASNPMAFNAERYLLSTVLGERRRLLRELHLLAAAYHWPLADILALTRTDRSHLASQIERDHDSRLKAGAA